MKARMNEEIEEEVEEPGESGSLITGEAVKKTKKEIEGVCSKENDFVYEIEKGKSVEIKKKSVKVEKVNGKVDKKGKVKLEKIRDETVTLQISEGVAVVSTDYSISESGFGEDFLKDEENYLEIDLSEFEMKAESGVLSVSLIYGDSLLAEVSEDILVEGEEPEEPEEPEGNVSGEVNITVPDLNVTVPINVTNVTVVDVNSSVMNLTGLNITTKQYKAIIGRPVKWLKKIKVNKTKVDGDLLLQIPKTAQNISIKTGAEALEADKEIEEYEQIIENEDKTSLITGEVTGEVSLEIKSRKGIVVRLWNWLAKFSITGNVILEEEMEGDIIEKQDSKEINLTDVSEQMLELEQDIAVEYYTEAPQVVEEVLKTGKKVVVSADDVLNYTEILAYTQVPNMVKNENKDSIKIYQYVYEDVVSEEVVDEGGVVGVINESDIEKVITEENVTEELEGGVSLITGRVVGNEIISESEEINESEQINESEEINESDGNLLSSVTKKLTQKLVKKEIVFDAHDLDADGYVDYLEWIVPHLSEQVYEIIYITKAEHLDSNRSFVSDIYEEVFAQDDVWSEVINDSEYVRVTFEKNLTRDKDITVYARVVDECSSGNGSVMINGSEISCEIYEKKKRIDEIRRLLENG